MHFLQESEYFRSVTTRRSYKIKLCIGCTTTNAIYLISCPKCMVQYVGSTSTQFKVRFRNHKSAMLTKKVTCETAVHFNQTSHDWSALSFIGIEKICENNLTDIDKLLLTREAYWTAQLNTLQPYDLNKRCELRSKNRIIYNVWLLFFAIPTGFNYFIF